MTESRPEDRTDPQAARPVPEIAVEPAPPEVLIAGETTVLPGAHRGGFTRPPTAPVDVAIPHPVELEEEFTPTGTATLPVTVAATWNAGPYALLFAITGLAVSLLVGWLFPVGIVAIVLAVIALRRPDQRRMGAWALGLAITSLVYSAIWLGYAAQQAGLI